METNSITDYLQQIGDIIPAIQMGLFPDGTVGKVYHKFAESVTVSTTATILQSFTNQDPFNTNGDVQYISSSDDTDNISIYIEGVLHSDGTIAAETITTTGQTAVQLQNIYKTILRGYNANGTPLVGDVWIGTEANPVLGVPAVANQYAHIPAIYHEKQAQQTLTSIFTVPTGYTGFITNWYCTAGKGKDVEMVAYAKPQNGVFRYQEQIFAFESSVQKTLPWLRFTEGADMKIEAATSTGTIDSAVTYDLVLLKNDFIDKFRPLAWR